MNIAEFSQYPLHYPKNKSGGPEKLADRITIAAGAMIFAHNKILLDRNEYNDLWSIPGGVVNTNEKPQDTVVRKLKDELNLNVSIVNEQPYLFHFLLETPTSKDLVLMHHYLAKVEGEARIMIGDGLADYKWESIGYHFRDCYPNIKPAVDYFLNF